MLLLFANNAETTLAQPLPASGPGSTTAILATGTGDLFPNPGSGEYFTLTLTDAATELVTEIAFCTARSGDSLTLERAQEGTTALAWKAGDLAANYNTAGTQEAFIQAQQQQEGTYTTILTPGGTLNAVTGTLPSPLDGIPDAMPVTFIAAGANTGTMTFRLTLGSTDTGALPIVKGNNIALSAGDVPYEGFPASLRYSATLTAWVLQNAASGPTAGVTLSGAVTGSGTTTITTTFGAISPNAVLANPTGSSASPTAVAFSSIPLSAWGAAGAAINLGGFRATNAGNATADTDLLTLGQAKALVTGLWDDRGGYDASSNVFPSSGGSGPAGAILKGDIWTIQAGGGGTLGGIPVVPGDTVRALTDAPGQTAGNWAIAPGGFGYAPLSSSGVSNHGVIISQGGTSTSSILLTAGQIIVGQGSSADPQAITLSGVVQMSTSGVVTFNLLSPTPITTDYALVLNDQNTNVTVNDASPNTVTIPPHSSVPFPTNVMIAIGQIGAGTTSVALGAGVTSPRGAGPFACSGQGGTIVIWQVAQNVWQIGGDLA